MHRVVDIEANKRTTKAIAVACFFISGASALIYEVIWTRLLGIVFGNTVFATSTVLTAYMSGLALGSYIASKWADRIRRHLRTYALLEFGIGIYCLLTPSIINLLSSFYYPLQRSLELSFYIFSLVRFVLCFVVLLVPTTLMGATLPMFSKYYVDRGSSFGREIGRLYGINTFGAFIGTIASGFFLIAYLGVRNTINVAFVGNLFAAVICLLIDRKELSILNKVQVKRKKESKESIGSEDKHEDLSRAKFLLLAVGFGVSGFSAMVYEVAWTRALVMIIGSSVYAFSIMLSTFLIGIAIGSIIFSFIARRTSVNIIWFAVAQLAIGILALVMLPLFQMMPLYFVNLFEKIVKNHVMLEIIKFFICFIIMFLPTTLLGTLFPMVTHLCTKSYSELGRKVGKIYSINTLGNIAGSFLSGFLLIPYIGIQNSIKLSAILNILVGSVTIFGEDLFKTRLKVTASIAFIALGAVAVIGIPSWDKMVISSGPAVYAPVYVKNKGDERKAVISGSKQKLLYYKEGYNGTITVKERESGTIVLAIDGKVDASNTGDMYTQLLLAHLPLLLSNEPKSALIIGLGSGVTLGASACHELERIDCVEIEPAVVEASKFFNGVNRNVLDDPRVNIIINDARNHLAVSNRTYDVIISEPSNIWLAGIANLFSSDFYKIVRKRLNPGGILCQWAHIYYMSKDDVKTVINTFRSVFPNTSIWFSSLGDILMIGTKEELVIDYLQMAKHYNIPKVFEDMQRLEIREPLALLSCYLLDEEGVKNLVANSRINSDDHPILEFSVPRSMYVDTAESNMKMIESFRTREFPKMKNFNRERVLNRASFWYHLGVAYDFKELPSKAKQNYQKAISVDPMFTPAYEGLALRLYKEKDVNGAIELLKKAITIDPEGADAYYNLAQIYEDQGFIQDAINAFEKAVKLKPNNNRYRKKFDELLKKYGKSGDRRITDNRSP